MVRRVSAFAVALLLLATLATGAFAAPKGETVVLDCTGIPSATIITSNGNGEWTPGFDVASNARYLPYAFETEFYFTPAGGTEELLDSESTAKRAPNNSAQHPHGVCTFGGTFELVDDPDLGTGTARFVGTVKAVYIGK